MTIADVFRSSSTDALETRLLVQDVCKLTHPQIISNPDRELSSEEEKLLSEYLDRCKNGEPLAYILGRRDFYKDCFSVCEGVLVPQPDTEILVENAVEKALSMNKKKLTVLDLCCGSGCIGISVAKQLYGKFDKVILTMADISPVCIQCTEKNASNLLKNTGVEYEVVLSDLFGQFGGRKYDLICTNPPYIRTDVIETLPVQVQKEPHLALDGGTDGLSIIRRILDKASEHLNEEGFLFMETGYDQGNEVRELFEKSLLTDVEVLRDFGNNDRVVRGQKCTKN